MAEFTASFCERRAREEMRASELATCSEAAASHRQLARQFTARAQALRAEEKLSASDEAGTMFRWKPDADPATQG